MDRKTETVANLELEKLVPFRDHPFLVWEDVPINKIARYFPPSYTPQSMEETVLMLLDAWQRARKTKIHQPQRMK